MKAYIQLVENKIVSVMYDYTENFIEVDLPEDFDFSHINWYEYTGEGQFIKHIPEEIIEPEIKTQEERITSLEERLDAYEASYASGVQEA